MGNDFTIDDVAKKLKTASWFGGGWSQHRTHGRSDTKEYHAWDSMLARCFNPNSDNYPRYGFALF